MASCPNELAALVEKLVSEGEQNLNETLLKDIKNRCKKHSDNVQVVYDVLMTQLSKTHAQIRYSCVQLAAVLFPRSHLFRQTLLNSFPAFCERTLGINQKNLPPPKDWAQKLRQLTLTVVKEWQEKFGASYKQLDLGFKYLSENLGISFQVDDIHFATSRAQAERERRVAEKKKEAFENALKEMNETRLDVEENLQKMAIESHGLGSRSYQLVIELKQSDRIPVSETAENHVVFETLRESYKVLIKSHMELVTKWLDVFTKASGEDKEKHLQLLKQMIDLRNMALHTKRKAEDLSITLQRPLDFVDREGGDDGSDEDDDEIFEEVPIHPAENNMDSESDSIIPPEQEEVDKPLKTVSPAPPRKIRPNVVTNDFTGSSWIFRRPHMEADDTGPSGSKQVRTGLSTKQGKESNGAGETMDPERAALLALAPEVEYGEDLEVWDKDEVLLNTTGFESSHFWATNGENPVLSGEALNTLKKRLVFVEPEKPKDIQPCRAPLRTGGLCKRRDLVKCPVHGPIIPRDENGLPIDPSQAPTQTQEQVPIWQEISADVEENIRAAKKSKTESKLVNIRHKPETSRTRLSKKLEDKARQKRLDSLGRLERELKERDRKAFSW
ncbi:hypothetical protein HK102_008980 [Quaeritorhiza haematococci]|nr:hypothetical protein HK102_008980 [Quaeritorhiza haematococci]